MMMGAMGRAKAGSRCTNCFNPPTNALMRLKVRYARLKWKDSFLDGAMRYLLINKLSSSFSRVFQCGVSIEVQLTTHVNFELFPITIQKLASSHISHDYFVLSCKSIAKKPNFKRSSIFTVITHQSSPAWSINGASSSLRG